MKKHFSTASLTFTRHFGLTLLLTTLLALPSKAQPASQALADSILQEGHTLYELQQAGLYSSRFIQTKLSVEGLYSSLIYLDGDTIHGLFFGQNGRKSYLKYHFTFNRPVEEEFLQLAPVSNKLSPMAKRVVKARKKVLKKVSKDEVLFNTYSQEPPNFAFLPKRSGMDVYIFTGREKKGHVPLGNDSRFVFSKKGKLKSYERLHNNFIPIDGAPKGQEPSPGKTYSSMHVHAEGNSLYMTPTDIATLLLYRDFVMWDMHYVFSEEYVSSFSLSAKRLTIISREEFERVNAIHLNED